MTPERNCKLFKISVFSSKYFSRPVSYAFRVSLFTTILEFLVITDFRKIPPTWNSKEFATARLFPSKNRLFIGELKSSKELVTLSECLKKKV